MMLCCLYSSLAAGAGGHDRDWLICSQIDDDVALFVSRLGWPR